MSDKLKFLLIGIGLALMIVGAKQIFWKSPAPAPEIRYLTDTVKVPGIRDTVRITKYIKGQDVVKIVYKNENITVDTLIGNDNAVIAIYSDDVKANGLSVNYTFNCNDFVISETDTVKIRVPVEVPAVEKPEPWYDEFEWGYVAGTVITGAVILLLGK